MGCNIFADAVAEHGGWLNPPAFPKLCNGVFSREKRGLGDAGFRQFDIAAAAENLVKIKIHNRLKDTGAAVDCPAIDWLFLVYILPHAGMLAALAAEQEGNAA